MGISQHILDHTLHNMFDNRCSAYARAIGVEPHDLGVAIQSVRNGGKSAKMLDATLELYARDRVAWDVLLHDYHPESGTLPPSPCSHSEINKQAREKYLLCAAQMKWLDDLCLYSVGLVDRMEMACCGANCDQRATCSAFMCRDDEGELDMPEDCPCVLFDLFTDSLLKYAASNRGRRTAL